ncbi:hypothetical protein F2Q70_00034671 [Brassica cretica]|uniref:Uncharacterized protein n=1 Tax=Brassica cretica TaxID=69181 RepID=A0A8S9JZF1_BRACR|nr:hypothetical protein F2Q70_00034671 [Brassica cretica]KAF3530137.1 hypothetical protein DY000_02037519 [Brassica cretica]
MSKMPLPEHGHEVPLLQQLQHKPSLPFLQSLSEILDCPRDYEDCGRRNKSSSSHYGHITIFEALEAAKLDRRLQSNTGVLI